MAETAVTVAVSVVVTIGLLLAGYSSARELRPSDHGLVFQTLSPAGSISSPEMRSFFNSENSSPSSNVALPRAMNSGAAAAPPSWLPASGGGSGGGRRVEKALTAASLVCGIAGGALLVASGLIYLKYRAKHEQNAAFRGGNDDGNQECENDDENKKLQLVVRDP